MKLEKYIDHTLLKADATLDAIEKLCKEAAEYRFASVCINPTYVTKANELLKDSDVKVCTVIGFPLGANVTDVKIYEAKNALAEGATELDYVLNISDVKNGEFDRVQTEMAAFVGLKDDHPGLVIKVILETCYLTDLEIEKVCEIAKNTKIDFVKTSTGFGSGGATEEAVALMKAAAGSEVEVKASGGVRTKGDAEKYIQLGATRIGTSNGVGIISLTDQTSGSGY
ncbi:deoxyribose-phosphate aldolase [Cytobacillus firmus]|uniref:deoxyribose-phosphate aldolase n=1 Tax=Cytobacillus firmus TaxID=1399 RepID=UPI0022283D99|nr:deoxyribose-phosphate aldolase [Cytobacillus firmus]